MAGDAKYFQTTKKGEIRELQDDLNSVDKNKIKEAVKKVIAAMTVGKDVSMLFSDVIKSMGTDNIELKKLIYLYIINYARSQPEKAVLIVNMFQKDATKHPNPLVRALAIRTMGCIHVDKITEYLCDPLGIALKDQDPYVRKTAAICVAKLYDINGELVEERGFIDSLRGLLSDVNPMVVANAVASLTEICENSGKDYFKIDNGTLSKLLTALNECTEWGRVFILEALSKFECKKGNANQARDICDRVVPQLAHANSAVVMAAVKVVIRFLKFLTKSEDVEKFCRKLAPPLVTLLSAPSEIQYVALRNIDLIVQKYPKILENDIRIFFVKFNDAVYVKMQKLEVLIKLTTQSNIDQVLMEFKEYAQEVDIGFVRRAVRAIGRIAIKLENAAEKCVHVLSELVKTKVNYVVQESVIVIKDIFRRYPRKYEKIIITLCDNLENLDEPEAKASMIWIIGEYAERIVDAGERLEHFVDSFQEESTLVQLQLLTATVKLFLKKPDKAKKLVQTVLHLATEESDNPDLRDRGYVYWRLLSKDAVAAKQFVLADRPIISAETFAMPDDFLQKLLNNISSLSSVYHRPPTEFVRGINSITFKQYIKGDNDESSEESSEEASGEESSEESDSGDDVKEDKTSKKKKNVSAKKEEVQEVKQEAPPTDDLLGDIFGGGPSQSTPQQPTTNTTTTTTTQGNNNNNDGGTFDLFDMFGSSQDEQQKPQESLPKMTQVSNTNGLTIEVGSKKENNESIIVFKFTNNGGTTIERMDIKFNANYLGITPKSNQLNLNGSIMNNTSQIVKLIVNITGNPVQKNPLDKKIQVAIRSIRNGVPKPPVNIFAFELDAIIFCCNNDMDKGSFLQTWKDQSIQPMQNQIKSAAITDNDAVKKRFSEASCNFIADRVIPNKGKALYFVTNLNNVAVLIEVSIANNNACRIIAKSQDKYLAFVVSDMAIQLMQ